MFIQLQIGDLWGDSIRVFRYLENKEQIPSEVINFIYLNMYILNLKKIYIKVDKKVCLKNECLGFYMEDSEDSIDGMICINNRHNLTTIAHELRHAWQQLNRPKWLTKHKSSEELSYFEYINQISELDAQIYSFWIWSLWRNESYDEILKEFDCSFSMPKRNLLSTKIKKKIKEIEDSSIFTRYQTVLYEPVFVNSEKCLEPCQEEIILFDFCDEDCNQCPYSSKKMAIVRYLIILQ